MDMEREREREDLVISRTKQKNCSDKIWCSSEERERELLFFRKEN